MLRLGPLGSTRTVATGGVTTVAAPTRQPGLYRRGLHHRAGTGGAQLLGQRGRLGPADSAVHLFPGAADCKPTCPPARKPEDWLGLATAVWRYIVRPIAVGSMMVGTCYTLFRMRKNLIAGLAKAFTELSAAAPVDQKTVGRTERYMSSKTVFG